MFSKVASLVTLSLAVFTFAAPADHLDYSTDCNPGSIQCCSQLHAPTSSSAASLASLVGVAVSSLNGQVGAQCNPISVFFGAGTAGNW